MTSKHRDSFRTSRYNLAVPATEATLLYNVLHGSVVELGGAAAMALARALARPRVAVFEDQLPAALFAQLVAGKFLIAPDHDELAVVQARYRAARDDAPVVMTITTTMDCNLGCYYCYEERSPEALSEERGDVDAVVAAARERLARKGKRSMHVDWYGGEPLLNPQFLEAASARLQALCAELGVVYSASIISNGTRWPDDVGAFVARHRIRQVQITFDGMRANHDKRRHYRKEHRREEDVSSFDQAIAVIDQLLDHSRVDIRFNVDRGNADDFVEMVRFARGRGWFDRKFAAAIQPARLMRFSERSEFMRKTELSPDEFEAARGRIAAEVPPHVELQDSSTPDGFPRPRASVCAALNRDAVVVGAERGLYRCGLQVGEGHRIVGQLDGKRRLPMFGAAVDDSAFWESFDPTTQPRCVECTFLPVCWSGCPKVHLERDAIAIRQQGEYWRSNLATLVARGVGLTATGHVYTHGDQFPDGEPETYLSTASDGDAPRADA